MPYTRPCLKCPGWPQNTTETQLQITKYDLKLNQDEFTFTIRFSLSDPLPSFITCPTSIVNWITQRITGVAMIMQFVVSIYSYSVVKRLWSSTTLAKCWVFHLKVESETVYFLMMLLITAMSPLMWNWMCGQEYTFPKSVSLHVFIIVLMRFIVKVMFQTSKWEMIPKNASDWLNLPPTTSCSWPIINFPFPREDIHNNKLCILIYFFLNNICSIQWKISWFINKVTFYIIYACISFTNKKLRGTHKL